MPKARTLSAVHFGGALIPANSLIDAPDALIADLASIGAVDADPSAVAYCEEEGMSPHVLEMPAELPAEVTPAPEPAKASKSKKG